MSDTPAKLTTDDGGARQGAEAKREGGSERKREREDDEEAKEEDKKEAAGREEGGTQLEGIATELCYLRQTLQSLVSGLAASPQHRQPLPPPRLDGGSASGTQTPMSGRSSGLLNAWASLKCTRTGRVHAITEQSFTFGRSSRCTLTIDDSLIASMAGRISKEGGAPVLVCFTGVISLNMSSITRGSRKTLRSGDRLGLSGVDYHNFVFTWNELAQHQEGAAAGALSLPPYLGGDDAEEEPNPSDIMARFVNPRVLRPPLFSAAAQSASSAIAAVSTKLAPTLDDPAQDSHQPPCSANARGDQMPAAAKRRKGDAETTPSVAVASEAPEQVANAATTAESVSSKLQLRITEFTSMVLKPEENVASFESFPYHLDPSTKDILMDSLALFLERQTLTPFTKNLTSLSPSILIEGPYGTELYQVELVRALAKQHAASLLILDASQSILVPDPGHAATTTEDDAAGAADAPGSHAMRSVRFARDGGLASLLRPPGKGSASAGAAGGKARLSKGDRVRYVPESSNRDFDASTTKGPKAGMVGEVVVTFDEDTRSTVGVRFDRSFPGGVMLGSLCEEGHGYFVNVAYLRPESEDGTATELEGLAIDALFEVAAMHAPCIVCVCDVESIVLASYMRYKKFQKVIESLPPRVVVIGLRACAQGGEPHRGQSLSERFGTGGGGGSRSSSLMDYSFLDHLRVAHDEPPQSVRSSRMLKKLLRTKISILAPPRNPGLARWKKTLEEDIKLIKLRGNKVQFKRQFDKLNVELDLDSLDPALFQQTNLSADACDQILGWAMGHFVRTGGVVAQDKWLLDRASFEHAIQLHRRLEDMHSSQSQALRNVQLENEFEKKIMADVVPADEINVTFADIGALDSVKNTLRELVLLPLSRPELFRQGNLTKPSKGVLLFGPPGTGKTMLAKAVATECRANFFNVSVASIASKWFGEGEKYAQAIFTLASKIAPSVIFIDEVDGLLGKRDKSGEHEAMRKIKNTIMSMWDGLKTAENERVIVLAATNRPFDLDDAVLRRLPRRLLVDLPDAQQREQVLRVICSCEIMEPSFNYADLAKSCEGYSGSDLHNLCVAAAYVPIREVLEAERARGLDPHQQSAPDAPPVPLRPLRMEDFVIARQTVASSVSEDAVSISELRAWNDIYGEHGSRRVVTLPYYI